MHQGNFSLHVQDYPNGIRRSLRNLTVTEYEKYIKNIGDSKRRNRILHSCLEEIRKDGNLRQIYRNKAPIFCAGFHRKFFYNVFITAFPAAVFRYTVSIAFDTFDFVFLLIGVYLMPGRLFVRRGKKFRAKRKKHL